MDRYKPKFSFTIKMVNNLANIIEMISKIEYELTEREKNFLRKQNRIRTITDTLTIIELVLKTIIKFKEKNEQKIKEKKLELLRKNNLASDQATDLVKKLGFALKNNVLSTSEIMKKLKLNHKATLPKQKYFLTEKWKKILLRK